MNIFASLLRWSRSEWRLAIGWKLESTGDTLPKHAHPAGMVQVGSITYRIFGVTKDRYGIVRVLDDRFLGTFLHGPGLAISSEAGVEERLVYEVARAAIRSGRTAWRAPAPLSLRDGLAEQRGNRDGGFVPFV